MKTAVEKRDSKSESQVVGRSYATILLEGVKGSIQIEESERDGMTRISIRAPAYQEPNLDDVRNQLHDQGMTPRQIERTIEAMVEAAYNESIEMVLGEMVVRGRA